MIITKFKIKPQEKMDFEEGEIIFDVRNISDKKKEIEIKIKELKK